MAAATKVKKLRLGKALITGTATGSATTVATNATGEDMTITDIIAYNQHTSAVDLYLCIVDDNALAVGTDTANDIIYYKSVAAKGSVFLGPEDIKITMNDTNDTLKAWASVASKINVWAYGIHEPDQT